MSKTPSHVSEKVDRVLDGLNATWDLQLPRLYDGGAVQAETETKVVARQCSSWIRFLCYKSEDAIDGCIDDFEESAKAIFSNWIWKPSQERGTIPTVSALESRLRRDVLRGKARNITPKLREALLKRLSSVLEDECKLAKDSANYQRISSQGTSVTGSRQTSFATAPSEPPSTPERQISNTPGKEHRSSSLSPHKRRQSSNDIQDGKRTKRHTEPKQELRYRSTVTDYWGKSKQRSGSTLLNTKAVEPSLESSEASTSTRSRVLRSPEPSSKLVTSFETVESMASAVFSIQEDCHIESSNDTSLMINDQESQDLFPTQDVNEILADESFTSAYRAADSFEAVPTSLFNDLGATGPFRHFDQLPGNLSFWLQWEIYRIAQAIEVTPLELYKAVETRRSSLPITYEEIWKTASIISKDGGKPLPQRSDVRPWMLSDNYELPDGKTTYFTFNLEYNQQVSTHIWKLKLNAIKIDKGNRIHRRFGADRHSVCFLNHFDKSSLPRWVTQRSDYDSEECFSQIVSWLATGYHHIVGRTWRAFFLEQENKRSAEGPRLKLSLLCVDGSNFNLLSQTIRPKRSVLSIAEFIEWHIPLHDNLSSTDLKLFSRFGLGLSKTIPTVVLRPDQFRHVPSLKPDMRDGCALISTNLARSVWRICGDGSSHLPSAFQARVGGGKGLWIVDYRSALDPDEAEDAWLEISDSQLKIYPHPRDHVNADESQRTFEVLKWSTPCARGHLNIQLINILVDRGVSRPLLRRVVLDDIHEYIESSRAAMRDPRMLQVWLNDYHTSDRYARPLTFEHGLPESKEEEVQLLVQSGFVAEHCERLRMGVISLMTQRLNTYVEKLRIEVPYSTSVFCIPDPYQVLDEDEVYLGFSSPWKDPRTEVPEAQLRDIDVLVARNPAALASDIQKRRAAYKDELHNFRDVIIFSTKGATPLASLLSGGDYDGDTVTVIWDPQIVDNFQEAQKPKLPNEEQCGLQKATRRIGDFVSSTSISQKAVDDFLTSCMLFNAQRSLLGICTMEHEKLIYSGAQLSDKGPVLLAALAGYLVDANKQGLAQTDASWFRIRKTASGGRKLMSPAYKSGEDLPRRNADGECINIIDYLKFDVAMKRKDDVLIEFEKLLPDAKNYDPSLSIPYKLEDERSRSKTDPESSNIKAILDDLKHRLELVMNEWMKCSRKRDTGENGVTFPTDIRRISSMIRDIKPLESDCDVYKEFVREGIGDRASFQAVVTNEKSGNAKGSRWSLLRASVMYKMYSRKQITWWTVGDELCRIKARSLGPTRELTPAMYHLLKPNSKLIKRLVGGTLEDGSGEADES